ncbi:insulin-like [Amphiprion ocellaris]|uniref:Insulin n=1 Tax=Amphiprion ocellaris TaxID=80972 RepID=A0AAQ5X936_AMPOC|nr:insulin-like [Amphiprion ocellaris]XP_023122407.1 insulin-like [Amphiprion ocellaris]
MAALWLHTAALLVLLVTSCPGSRAISTQHLCGAHLVDALYLVCWENGFTYNPGSNNGRALRFLPPKTGRATSSGGENEAPEFAFNDAMEMLVKPNIVEQCCARPCSIYDLSAYCN